MRDQKLQYEFCNPLILSIGCYRLPALKECLKLTFLPSLLARAISALSPINKLINMKGVNLAESSGLARNLFCSARPGPERNVLQYFY